MQHINEKLSKPKSLDEQIQLIKAGSDILDRFLDYFMMFDRDNEFYREQITKMDKPTYNLVAYLYVVQHPIKSLKIVSKVWLNLIWNGTVFSRSKYARP